MARAGLASIPSAPIKVVAEALQQDGVAELSGIQSFQAEVKSGDSRIDFVLNYGDSQAYVEVKSVTLEQDSATLFPDSVTARGKKHLEHLAALKQQGYRAVNLFVVQRQDVDSFKPATEIDPAYASALKAVQAHGVEILVYASKLGPQEWRLEKALQWQLE